MAYRRIIIGNPLTDDTYKTYLASQYTSGTSLTVLSNVSFATNDFMVIGEVGEELTEQKQISSLSGKTTINIASALNFSHAKDTPIYKVLWDFVSIEGRSSSSGTFAELTQSPIQWDKRDTIYYHNGGSSTWQYRFRFYNSSALVYSEYSPTVSGGGFTRNQVGFMLDRVRQLTQDFDGRIATDPEIFNDFSTAQDIIYGRNPKYWFLKVDTKHAATGISATANNSIYTLASYTTLGHLDTLRYEYVSGTTDILYHLERKSDTEFDALTRDQNLTKDDWPLFYKLLPADASSDQGYFQVSPTIKDSSIGTFYPNYYEKMADLDSVDDKTQVPLPSLLENFAVAQIEKRRGNDNKAKIYEDRFWGPADRRESLEKVYGLVLLDEMDKNQKRAQGQPQSISRYVGRKNLKRLFGQKRISSPDYERENYF